MLLGAGLSMAAPSSVPSAATLAQENARCYRDITSSNLDPNIRDDLEKQAIFFHNRGDLVTFFLDRLVNWTPFHGTPNNGHRAIADFLWCKAIEAAVTTNVDELVEIASRQLGARLMTSLNLDEMNRRREHSSIMKLHGCAARDRDHTLWCIQQLDAPAPNVLADNIRSCVTWLRANLQGKDLVFIGFWSDWAYLNRVLADSVAGTNPPLVILVDPANDTYLQAKAPVLWGWARQQNFGTVKVSGTDFLEELRAVFCRNFIGRVIAISNVAFTAITGEAPRPVEIPTTVDTEDLYSIRRDLCGAPEGQIATPKRPSGEMSAAGAMIRILLLKDASIEGDRFIVAGSRVRVINGAGKFLSQVKVEFAREAPRLAADDITICAGAEDDGGIPSNIVRVATASTIVRPALAGEWMTAMQAKGRLG